ncbi:RNA-binding domain-containing protein [Bifidobacterium platyrrhinorum]|uniref:AAA family ATPase n=1 Tax=Bifidobacterium platyrrhinorum TaxID=2661628 RepID=A0A6L9SQV2_9BIFI|nr:RNA-binding domain-containing protein [Bifidobacterium platyrrhinorum]NEG54864.1 AAA family ATPase [Bifidobacterium platyrrhinorum]
MINHREDAQTEFKRDWTDGAKRSAVAFANSDGGTIYLGIEDDGTIVGVPNPDESMRRATQAISDGIKPDPMSFVSVDTETASGHSIVVVHIQRGTNRPYYLADKGIRPAGVYIRSGAASIPASESAIVDMIRTTAGGSFEDALSLDQNLTFTFVQRVFADNDLAFTPSSQRTLGMVNPNETYTNLAWLLSDQCTSSIKAAVFADAGKETFLNRQEFSGSLLAQLDQLTEFINRHNAIRSRTGSDMRRIDTYDYSPTVLREVVLNMIVHRDYGLSGPALVSIFDDHMEFLNLGGLPGNFTRDDMMNGISSQRNPKLVNVFYRLKLVEAYGTGIRRIISDYRGDSRQPQFDISDHSFKVVLPRHTTDDDMDSAASSAESSLPNRSPSITNTGRNTQEGGNLLLNERQRLILDYAIQHGSVTRRQAQQIIGMSPAMASSIIRELVGAGMLTRKGQGPATTYLPM